MGGQQAPPRPGDVARGAFERILEWLLDGLEGMT